MENLEKPDPDKMPNPEIEPKSVEAEAHADLVAKYSLFREKLNPKADLVYHPCGANDVSPSIAFPNSRVVYVDIDEKSVDALKRGGFEAHTASALEFDPGNVDILILLNPQIPPNIPASHVVKNGFILSNDYHGTASTLHHSSDQYQIRAMVRTLRGGELILDTKNLEDYWKEIDTEEEFKNAPFDWGAANYEAAVTVVEAVTGKKENILAEYKKIIATAREELRQKNAKILEEQPQMADFINNADEAYALMFKHNEKEFFLATTFPKKKGTVDDIFVFQKIAHEEDS